MDVASGFGAGVRLSIPPWPSEKFHAEEGVPIRGLSIEDLHDFFYPYDVKSSDGLFSSGGYGIVGVCNASGGTIQEAFAKAYKRLEKNKISDGQYRTDLAKVCLKDYEFIEGLD